jgi:hypothetical protein
MNWTEVKDGELRCGHYSIHRGIRSFNAYRWSPTPKLLGICQSELEAKLLASLDQALQKAPDSV